MLTAGQDGFHRRVPVLAVGLEGWRRVEFRHVRHGLAVGQVNGVVSPMKLGRELNTRLRPYY